MEKLLVSACLLGYNCKYDGGNNALPAEIVEKLRKKYELIPACPEAEGGLPTPRKPSERKGGRVVNTEGTDVSAEYRRGAEVALKRAEKNNCRKAVLKERSPSCGSGRIYDGSFSHSLIEGDGVAAELLKKNGIAVFGESETEKLL